MKRIGRSPTPIEVNKNILLKSSSRPATRSPRASRARCSSWSARASNSSALGDSSPSFGAAIAGLVEGARAVRRRTRELLDVVYEAVLGVLRATIARFHADRFLV